MSEDYISDRDRKKEGQEEGRKSAPDIFGSLGKGELDKENIETLRKSSGLTPLGFGFDVDIREKVLNRGPMSEGLSTTELKENAEILMNSSGLSPLRPFGEIHNEDVKNDSLEERVSDKLDAETLENSSGLTTLHPDSEIHKKRVIE